jgi:DEAD/DEAH box helicase domain-containing protein
VPWSEYKFQVQGSKFKVQNYLRFTVYDLRDRHELRKWAVPGGSQAAGLNTVPKNVIYFDLETQKSAEEVGGWNHIAKMGMSIGVTFSTARGNYKIFGEKQVNDLIVDLQRADLVVGFNIMRFDYEVLHGYTTFDLRQLPTLDMMVELQNQLQHRLSLDSIATATFGVEKTAEGMQAIRWFKDGKLAEIAEYCCYDVKLTKLVHEYGQKHRQLHYQNRFGKKMTVPVSW